MNLSQKSVIMRYTTAMQSVGQHVSHDAELILVKVYMKIIQEKSNVFIFILYFGGVRSIPSLQNPILPQYNHQFLWYIVLTLTRFL
jgi:hypothetical protein